jgi:hypothetical protein
VGLFTWALHHSSVAGEDEGGARDIKEEMCADGQGFIRKGCGDAAGVPFGISQSGQSVLWL